MKIRHPMGLRHAVVVVLTAERDDLFMCVILDL